MRRKMKPSREANLSGYIARLIKRMSKIVFWLFILFLLIMAIIWAVPKVWNWALG